MKTLIIADLHNKVHWVEECIEKVSPDLTVFLGDYFDSFDETDECVRQTAQWLKKSINQPNRVHLLGNHDMPYRFPISFNLLHPIKGFDLDDLCKVEKDSLEKCFADISTPFFGCGMSRGGNYRCGGITWQDFDADFIPIEGVNQIVGHTPHSKVKVKYILEGAYDVGPLECEWEEYVSNYDTKPKKSLNLGIDTHRQHFATLKNGKVEIHQNTFASQEDSSE